MSLPNPSASLASCFILKGNRIDDHQLNKLIGCAVVAIIIYYLLQAILPLLIGGVIGLVVWRVYQQFNKLK